MVDLCVLPFYVYGLGYEFVELLAYGCFCRDFMSKGLPKRVSKLEDFWSLVLVFGWGGGGNA